MKRILFVTYKMGYGGAERVITLLANQMVKSGVQVKILVKEDTARNYPLDQKIIIEKVKQKDGFELFRPFRRIMSIRKSIREFRSDCVLGFITEIDVLLATLGTRNKVIISERGDPAKAYTTLLRIVRNVFSDSSRLL